MTTTMTTRPRARPQWRRQRRRRRHALRRRPPSRARTTCCRRRRCCAWRATPLGLTAARKARWRRRRSRTARRRCHRAEPVGEPYRPLSNATSSLQPPPPPQPTLHSCDAHIRAEADATPSPSPPLTRAVRMLPPQAGRVASPQHRRHADGRPGAPRARPPARPPRPRWRRCLRKALARPDRRGAERHSVRRLLLSARRWASARGADCERRARPHAGGERPGPAATERPTRNGVR